MNQVKIALPMGQLKDMRRWLIDHCGRRWSAYDYAYKPVNWRMMGKVPDRPGSFSITTWIDFTKREDMMLFLLAWPGEVAVSDSNEWQVVEESDKYTCYKKVTPVSNLISA